MQTLRPRMLLSLSGALAGLLLPLGLVLAQAPAAPAPAGAGASTAHAADDSGQPARPRPGTRPPGAADDLEPAVSTSDTAARAPASLLAPAAPTTAPAAATTGGTATKTAGNKAMDRLELDTTQITGNRELPKVLYIVPWKRSDLGDLVGKPANSLLDEVLEPVDRDVFKRENRYYRAVMPKEGASSGGAAGASRATGSGTP